MSNFVPDEFDMPASLQAKKTSRLGWFLKLLTLRLTF